MEESANVTWSSPVFHEHLNLQTTLSIVKIDETHSSIFGRSIEDDEGGPSIVATALGETPVCHTLNLDLILFP